MQSAKVKVQQMALMAALKLKEPIFPFYILHFAICILKLIAQNPQDFEQLR